MTSRTSGVRYYSLKLNVRGEVHAKLEWNSSKERWRSRGFYLKVLAG